MPASYELDSPEGSRNHGKCGLADLAATQEQVIAKLEAVAARLAVVEIAPAPPTLDEEMERLREEAARLAAQLEDERQCAERSRDEVQTAMQQARQALDDAVETAERERLRSEELARELEAARSQSDQARSEAEQAQDELLQIRRNFEDLKAEMAQPRQPAEDEASKAAERALIEERSRLEAALDDARTRAKEARAEALALSAELAEAQRSCAREERRTAALAAEIETLEARLAEAVEAAAVQPPPTEAVSSGDALHEPGEGRELAANRQPAETDAPGVRFWKACCLGLMLILVVALSTLWSDKDRQKTTPAPRQAALDTRQNHRPDDKEPAAPAKESPNQASSAQKAEAIQSKAAQPALEASSAAEGTQASSTAPTGASVAGQSVAAPGMKDTVSAFTDTSKEPASASVSAAGAQAPPTPAPAPGKTDAAQPAAKSEVAAGPDQFSLPFPPATDTLAQAQDKDVAELVKKVLAKPRKAVLVLGYADSQPLRGVLAKRYPDNVALAQARAMAVARALVAGGVPEKLVSACGVGAARPLAQGHPAAAGALARRADVLAW